MPKPKSTNVLLEQIQSEVKQVAEGQSQLRGEMQREFQELQTEMDQRFSYVEQAIKENSRDIKAFTERLEEHLKERAT